MASVLDTKSLDEAFESRPDLRQAIRLAAVGGNYIELFNQISLHVRSLVPETTGPACKKRRLDDEVPSRPANGVKQNGASNGESAVSSADEVLLEIKEISVVVPQRKKYTLCLTASHIYARLPDSPEPIAGISYAWKDIEYAFCLPVPEKTHKQFNYILFPKNSNIILSKPSIARQTGEPLVFTIPDAAPKAGIIGGKEASQAAAVSDDFKTLLDWALSQRFKASGRSDLKIAYGDAKLFASEQKQPHRPGEKALFVKAFRGAKDGYLYFLPNGILWAFKKPLQFLPHERIAAVSYTSVLQRTFNLSVEVDMSSTNEDGEVDDNTEEFEFSMLDQEDFAGIDAFVKRHGLSDKSMAEQRKAKRLNVNVVKDDEGNVVGHAESGELERAAAEAEQAAQDDEDEEEEDYNPGSEGESEGSGSSSEEDDDDDAGGGGGAGEEDEDEDEDEDEEDEL
ncbi:hypothetical protein BJ875DRAFT_436045 [Amylocarpus encephaloides]|uniref:Histone chaperone RTT106/FACT complex subunit SPT16-like middle domain-containing protein n=1 Tax=Amylocarpus encephaloides TaxID=45428 RepID=A0A9P8C0C3_9HELO|nr:hypothetical protein BJ875DRAFT_436045 [Amylocarpus encephaloides]